MTLATTRARAVTLIAGVSGVENVFSRMRTATDRADAEAAYVASGGVQAWEVSDMPRVVHGGASGYLHTELDIEVRALWRHDDAEDSRGDFISKLNDVMLVLAHPTTGFPQLQEEGVVWLEKPDQPVRLRTGQSAYQARFRLSLWDTENT